MRTIIPGKKNVIIETGIVPPRYRQSLIQRVKLSHGLSAGRLYYPRFRDPMNP